jgi:serine phosphatase RsbU (regulator of sigma subunit)
MMLRRIFLSVIILFFTADLALAQASDTTYLNFRSRLGNAKNDTVKADVLNHYCNSHFRDPDTTLKYAKEMLKLGLKMKYDNVIMDSYGQLGDAYWYMNNFDKAGEFYFLMLQMAEHLKDKKRLARAYYNIGWMKCVQNDQFEDRAYLLNALKMYRELGDTTGMFAVCNGLGGMYNSQIRTDRKFADSSEKYYSWVISVLEMKHRPIDLTIQSNYAGLLVNMKKYSEAKKLATQLRDESLKRGDSSFYATSLTTLSRAYLFTDSGAKAKKLLQEAVPILQRAKRYETLVSAYYTLSEIYKGEKKFEKALEYYEMCMMAQDSIETDEYELNLKEKEAQYQIMKKEESIQALEHENELSVLKNKQSDYIIYSLGAVALLIVIISINLFRANRSKLEVNKLLNEKNLLIEDQKRVVDERNHDVTNSINYAKRIQEAVLPAKEIKYKLFPDAFVLFLPKDIVSGDFYWFGERNGKRLISAIDCTGHGVPGAFMSLIGNTFLHEAVNEKGITEPAKILDDMKRSIIAALKQSAVVESAKDGMDMALLSFDDKKGTVEFAGAYNPCWLVRNGELTEFKGDKKPIGYYMGNDSPFTNTEIKIQKGDCFYIFSDGYADQFGGEKGKKLKEKQLKEILLSCHELPMAEQEKILLDKFQKWKGKLEQVDDVCLIGVRV